MKNTTTRRQFLTTTMAGAAAAYLAPVIKVIPKEVIVTEVKSRVILAAHNHIIGSNEKINAAIVRTVLDENLIALTNTTSVKDAWIQIFPALQSTEVIGIKVNCAEPRLPSHPEVVYAIAQSLIDSLDVNPNNILIWERSDRGLRRAKYTINTSDQGIRCFGNVHRFTMVDGVPHNILDESIGYDENAVVDIGKGKQVHLSKILTRYCTYLINVPVLKDHNCAGVTLSLKNHYGSIDEPWLCHENFCDPYIANLNAVPHIKDKTKLILCDALFGIYRGGPQGAPQWINRQLLASTDPVALDYVGMTIINQQRQKRNIRPVSQEARHIHTAAQRGLGTDDPQHMDMEKLQF